MKSKSKHGAATEARSHPPLGVLVLVAAIASLGAVAAAGQS